MRGLQKRSVPELLDRSRQALWILLERTGISPSARAPADIGLQPTLPFPQLSPADVKAVYGQRPAERAAIIEHADAALAGRLHLLGLRDLDFGDPVDWHLDPTRNRRAPGGHWSRVPYLDEHVVGDHKIIWELNRHQWLVTLAQAWRLTDDPRYLEHIATTFDGWLDANPPRQGINWVSSLELAFRTMAWTWTLHLTGTALPNTRDLHGRLLDALVQQGVQIERHLSTWFSPNTHLTGEALGLLYLGASWPALPQAGRWRAVGWRILMDQLPIQVRPDGSYFEQASWYQAYTADFYLHGLLLARGSGLPVPAGAEERIADAVAVVAELLRPDGTLPLIGDDDGGRLLPLAPVRTDFRATVALGTAVLHRSESCRFDQPPAATAWLVGRQRWHDLAREFSVLPPPQSLALVDGGWYLLRGTDGSLLIDAGPHGALAGGHSHADALALDLTVGGRPVIVDPGTGAYVGTWRDRFRETAAHSTLSLADGTGSATPTGQFRWGRWPRITIRHWSEGDGWAAFEAEHDGFTDAVPGLFHRRTVIFRDGRGWLVLDRLLGAQAESRIRFQLDLGLEAVPDQEIIMAQAVDGRPILRIVPDGQPPVALLTGLVSHAYGAAAEAPVVVRQLAAADGLHGVATLLTVTPDGTVTRDKSAGGLAWLWQGDHPPARLEIGDDGVTTFRDHDLSLSLD